MNTYIQDVKIPIYISLSYDHFFLKFPINPENIKMEIGSSSTTAEIEGLGEISVPKIPDLAQISIESFFWQQVNLTPSAMYVNWIKKWQKSGKPANLIVTRLNYSMQVTCESFNYDTRAGEEQDVYFELQLQEYRPHEAKKLNMPKNTTLLQKVQHLTDTMGSLTPILVDIPVPTRNSTKKQTFLNPYVCGVNETLSSIAKKITGLSENWKSIYDNNKSLLGNLFESGTEIPENTKLTLAESWVSDSNYNIVQGAT